MLITALFVVQVDGELWDLERPFEKSAKLELFDFESPEGKPIGSSPYT